MTKVKQFILQMKEGPHDERIEHARNHSSWVALIALFATYIIVTLGYGFLDQPVPGPLQLTFYVPLITFVIMNMKQDGFQFSLPWIKETETTLEQPAIIRSVPWLFAVTGILAAVTNILINPITIISDRAVPFELWLVAGILTILTGIIGVCIDIYIANRLKRGDRLFLSLTKWISLLLGILLLSYVIPYLFAPDAIISQPGEPLATQGADLFFTLSYLFQFYVIAKYGKRMHEDGQSFEQLPEYDKKREKLVRNWVLFIIFGLPFVGILIALLLRDTIIGELIREYIQTHPELFSS